MLKTQQSLPLAISYGEPAGIGPDVLLLSWAKYRRELPNFFVLGDPDHLSNRARTLGIDFSCRLINPTRDLGNLPHSKDALPVCPLANRLRADVGKPLSEDGAGVVEAIERGVSLVHSGFASGLVTLPIHKKSLYDCGFNHPGHTEFLGELAYRFWPQTKQTRPIMMLAGPQLRAVPVTIHIPLSEVPAELTTADIIETVAIADHDLRIRFGIDNPRIAISGLNPHAGEDGTMGREDMDVIAPAIAHLQDQDLDCFGPLPADTMFHPEARERYDCAVCMYHDQALIPAKALAFDETVNVTLGLPFVRTSPDHGTAFDIAGTGKAKPDSFIAALQLAAQMGAHAARANDSLSASGTAA